MQDEERTRLLADLDHLLKSPLLMALRQCDATLRKDVPAREDLVLIRALCAKAWSRLSTATAFSRVVANKPINPNLGILPTAQLARLLTSAVQDAAALDRRRPNRLHLSIGADPELMIEVDTYLVEMVIREVIDNAVKYSFPESLISVTLNQSDGDSLMLSVTNESQPISPEEMRQVLNRGFRGRHASLATPAGAGIGLSFVNTVMNAQGGAVKLESQGQLFTVELVFPIKGTRTEEA